MVFFVSPPSNLQLIGHSPINKGYPDSISRCLRVSHYYTLEGGRISPREEVEIGENSLTPDPRDSLVPAGGSLPVDSPIALPRTQGGSVHSPAERQWKQVTTALLKPPTITPKPRGNPQGPAPTGREVLCSRLAGRPRPAFGTPGSSLEQNSPQGSSLQATARPTDSGRVPDEARGSQRSRESGVGQSGAPVKWLRSPGGNSRFLQQPQ